LLAAAQIVGGLITPVVRAWFRRRTTMLLVMLGLGAAVGAADRRDRELPWAVLALIVLWGLLTAAATPVRQAYLNGMIPSQQRATPVVRLADGLQRRGGAQPLLGRAADVWGYPARTGCPARCPRWRCRSSGCRGASGRPTRTATGGYRGAGRHAPRSLEIVRRRCRCCTSMTFVADGSLAMPTLASPDPVSSRPGSAVRHGHPDVAAGRLGGDRRAR
jgi:hypothetical protein